MGCMLLKNGTESVFFAFVCDAPARAFLKCIKGHTAYYSCERCIIKGTWTGRVVFNSDTVASPRTNERFQNLEYDIHQTKRSPLIDIGFPCVRSPWTICILYAWVSPKEY